MADLGAEDRTKVTPGLFGPCPSPPAQVTPAHVPSQHAVCLDLDPGACTGSAVYMHDCLRGLSADLTCCLW